MAEHSPESIEYLYARWGDHEYTSFRRVNALALQMTVITNHSRMEPVLATMRGTISYQAAPTPTSILYIISPKRWYSMEVTGGSPSSTFRLQVDPGTYQLMAFPVGSENLAYRPAAAYSTGSGLGALTVTAGQVVEGIHVQNINSDQCVNNAFPASPDGRFPALEADCN